MKWKKIISFTMLFAILLTGCGEDIPELIKPSTTVELYYTVVRGNLSNEKMIGGVVAPELKTVFFNADGSVYDLSYRVGDEVKEGDVIIKINESIAEQVSEFEEELEKYQNISGYYKEQQANVISSMNKTLQTLSGVERELYALDIKQQELDDELFNKKREFEYADLEEEYNKLLEASENSIVTAPCDGVITYIGADKNNGASKGEVALVIADESKKIIQFDYKSSDYFDGLDEFTIQVGDTVYDNMSMIYYTEDEIEEYEKKGISLYSRAVIDTLPEDVEFGTYCAVHMVSDTIENVMYVPNVSVKRDIDNGTNYCLVKQENGTDTRVMVETGMNNGYYTEIKAGLEEGQSVYFGRDLSPWNSVPESTEAYIGNYTHSMTFQDVHMTADTIATIAVGFPGNISEVFLDKTSNVYVEEGTPIFSVTPIVTEDERDQIQAQYDGIEDSIESETEYYDKLIDEKQQQINSATTEADKSLLQYELEELEEEKADSLIRLSNSLVETSNKLILYEEALSGKDIVITAPVSGMLNTNSALVTGAEIVEDMDIGTIYSIDSYVANLSDHVEVIIDGATVDSDGYLKYGNKVQIFSDAGNTTADGIIVTSKNSVPSSVWGEAAVRFNDDNDIIRINQNNTYITFTDIDISNVVLIDTSFIYNGDDGLYVLLQDGENVVTRYIQTGTPLIGNDTATWVTSGLAAGDVCIKR